tara:strand:+ start:9876 stop:10874 length:999 start_codon:yes stop_codon:yes gene_type:complete
MMNNIITKNKEYMWKEERYNYNNSKYDYIKQLFSIVGDVVLSQRIAIYSICVISFLIMLLIIKFKFPDLISNGSDVSFNYNKYMIYTTAVFLIILFIIIIYLITNFRKYNSVYKYNKNINDKYIKYLNREYLKIICNNFIDENYLLTTKCNIKTKPSSKQLQDYLNSLNIDKIYSSNIDLNDKENKTSDNIIATKFLSALITHQWLLFIYNNQSLSQTKENKMCGELKLNTIMNNKMYNIFYCYPETMQHPFESDVENNVIKIQNYSTQNFNSENYKVYVKIIDKYLSINNEISMDISNIKKEDINEINILMILYIIMILYAIGLFMLPTSN